MISVDIGPKKLADLIIAVVDPSEDLDYSSTIQDLLDQLASDRVKDDLLTFTL